MTYDLRSTIYDLARHHLRLRRLGTVIALAFCQVIVAYNKYPSRYHF